MKKPQPDIEHRTLNSFISNVGGVRKLKRYWGTGTVDGVEVLSHRQYYHPVGSRQSPKDFERVMRFIGTYEDLKDSNNDGLEAAWLYFNRNKTSSNLTNASQFVADNLNLTFWDPADGAEPEGLTLTTSIVIDRKLGRPPGVRDYYGVSTTDLLNPTMTEEQKIQVVQDNYETLWDTCLIRQVGVGVINKGSYEDPVNKTTVQDEDDLSPNDPWLDVISGYALRDYGVPCTIKSVVSGINTFYIPSREINGKDSVYVTEPVPIVYPTYIVTIEIPVTTFSPGSLLVDSIVSDITATYSARWSGGKYLQDNNGYYIQRAVKAMSTSDIENDSTSISRPYVPWESATIAGDPRFAAIWYGNSIRADAITNPRKYGLTFKELYPYLFGIIDSGYQKKKVKWYKKALAIIIFIIIVVVAFITGQAWLASQGAAWYTTLAAAITVASLAVSLLALAASALGEDEWAMAFAHANKKMAPLVTVASIVLIVTGIGNALEAANTAATAAGTTTAEVLKDMALDYVKDMATEVLSGAADVFAGNLVSAEALKFLTVLVKVGTMPQQNKVKELNAKNSDLRAEYAELTQEMSREYDVLKGFAKVYAKPATADWSMYASTYDLPYESGGGPLAMGNIQRTTKQALRKGTYDDPAFDNILVV